MKKTKKEEKKSSPQASKTEFNLFAPQAKAVFLSGDFNAWDPSSHPMKKDKNGVWKIFVNLDPGQHQYRFRVDGEWQNDPGNPECVANPFGTSNCLKTVLPASEG